MWLANCAHYDVSIPAADNRELWRRIMDRDYPVGALVCGASVGEVRSSALRTTCFVRTHSVLGWFANLKDLWVEPSARGAGWVRKLIDASVARRRDLGWRRIYWHTETDNLPARRLYNSAPGSPTTLLRHLHLPAVTPQSHPPVAGQGPLAATSC